MNSYRARPVSSTTLFIVTITFLLLSPTISLKAQEEIPRPPRPAGNPEARVTPRPPSLREREYIFREMEREISKPPTPERVQLALAQIKEDFERIQAINNQMMSATIPAKTLDYKRISDVTSEIRKRANRLKANLSLPKPESAEKNQKIPEINDGQQLKASLLLLDETIMRFVKNPIFRNTDVVDVKHSASASRDLDGMIELSQLINKSAERLSKASKKPEPSP